MVPIEQKDWTEEDRASKPGQNHPLDSTKRQKYKLQAAVEEAFRVSASTVRGWERLLPTQLDPFYVANALWRAKRCGEVDRTNGSQHFEGVWGSTALLERSVEFQGFNQTKSV